MNEFPSKLAFLGGAPAFSEPIHVGRPNIGNRERLFARVSKIIETRWLSNGGPFVREFEERIADMVGVRHCIATSNATAALEIAIRALDLSGEVIIPAFTFVATAHALQWQGVTPVFCDIDPATYNIDPSKIEQLITPRTTGILAVHLWGRPCNINELAAIAERHHLKLLFDAAHAIGCRFEGRPIGSFGHAEVLSFHATKVVNAGEGGAVVTNDDTVADRIRLMRNFGFSDYDNVVCLGTNGKMSELSAAMGLTNLDSREEFTRINRLNLETYENDLREIGGLSFLRYDPQTSPNYHYVVMEVDKHETGLSRDQLLLILHAENVLARRYFYPGVHRMEPYRSLFPEAGSLLPHTEAAADRVLVLPTGTAVTPADVRRICGIIRVALERGSGLRESFAHTAF